MDLHLVALGHLRDTGVFTVREATEYGLSADAVNAYVRRGHIVRLSRGRYLDATIWQQADAARRHALRTAAHGIRGASSRSEALALSHTSAAAWWGLPLLSIPHRGHLTRAVDGPGYTRVSHTVHRRYGPGQCLPPGQSGAGPVRPPESRVVTPALAALGVAHLQGFVPGVVALDAALGRALVTTAEVDRWLASLEHWPGLCSMRQCAAAADARSESPMETQARLILHSLGYRPELQVTLRTSDGAFVGRVDMLLEELGVVVEVDGRVKYSGAPSTEVVISEKRRESAIVDLGYAVLRLEHHHFEDIPGVDKRVRAAARRAQPRRQRHQ